MNLKEYMKKNKLNLSQMSKILNVSISYLSKYNNNVIGIKPKEEFIKKLKELNIEFTYTETNANKNNYMKENEMLKKRIYDLERENYILKENIMLAIKDTCDKLLNKRTYIRNIRKNNIKKEL